MSRYGAYFAIRGSVDPFGLEITAVENIVPYSLDPRGERNPTLVSNVAFGWTQALGVPDPTTEPQFKIVNVSCWVEQNSSSCRSGESLLRCHGSARGVWNFTVVSLLPRLILPPELLNSDESADYVKMAKEFEGIVAEHERSRVAVYKDIFGAPLTVEREASECACHNHVRSVRILLEANLRLELLEDLECASAARLHDFRQAQTAIDSDGAAEKVGAIFQQLERAWHNERQ